MKLANDKVEQVSGQNKALTLQRKSLMQAKESASRELEKLLKLVDSMKNERLQLIDDHDLQMKTLREETNQTILELRDANEKFAGDYDTLSN